MEHYIPCGNKNDCTGCAACAAACPHGCLTMQPDKEGFVLPVLNIRGCTHCDICLATCPILKNFEAKKTGLESGKKPLDVYAAWNLDAEVRRESSSGGVFSALAENIIAKGGVVVGAAFDERMVVRHITIEDCSQLYRLRGSKYVQSELSVQLYKNIRTHLTNGRKVLFSGTPCQIAGLRQYLRKEYENLFCCDLLCHGVPSPVFLKNYISHKEQNVGKSVKSINFRSKINGWSNLTVKIILFDEKFKYEEASNNEFLSSFLLNFSLRESCYHCQFSSEFRFGDITLGDFWRVEENYPNYNLKNEGTSIILCNTMRGQLLLKDIKDKLFVGQADINAALKGNMPLFKPQDRPEERDNFYIDIYSSYQMAIRKYELKKRALLYRAIRKIFRFFT